MANLKEISIKNPLIIGALVVSILAVIVGALALVKKLVGIQKRKKSKLPPPPPPATIKDLPEISDEQIKEVLKNDSDFLQKVEEAIENGKDSDDIAEERQEIFFIKNGRMPEREYDF